MNLTVSADKSQRARQSPPRVRPSYCHSSLVAVSVITESDGSWQEGGPSEGVRSVTHTGPAGKGAALKTGVRAARGRYILFTDAHRPYGFQFFVEAIPLLRSGVALVVGNRRRQESWFEVPVPLPRYVYGRHRLSLVFNRLVRLLLPITCTDTQAGSTP